MQSLMKSPDGLLREITGEQVEPPLPIPGQCLTFSTKLSQTAHLPILLARSPCKNVLFEMRIISCRIRATQVRSGASGSHLPFHHGFLRRFVEMDLGVHVIDPFDRDEVRSAAGVRVILRQDDQVGTFLVVDRADVLTI
jgi:hypothetical protein